MGKIVVMVVGGIVGAIVGGALAFGIAILVGTISKAANPNDPSAFAIADPVGLVAFPFGVAGGAVGGAMLAGRLMR